MPIALGLKPRCAPVFFRPMRNLQIQYLINCLALRASKDVLKAVGRSQLLGMILGPSNNLSTCLYLECGKFNVFFQVATIHRIRYNNIAVRRADANRSV